MGKHKTQTRSTKSVNEDIILPPPKGFRDRPPKPTRKPNDDFNFDDDIFQTENTSLGKFKIVGIRNRENKKFKSYTNEFRVKILKELDDDNEIYHIFQELVKTVKKRRNLSNNDMIRVVIQNEELPNAISTKFNKVESFKLGDLENIINIMEYRGIPLETSKIIVQSVKIPTGKGRLYLTKDTISRKCCIITVKNDNTTCLARSIVTAMANMHPEKWTKTQLHDGFNKSRKLQKEQAMKLHEEANVEINDYGNDFSDIEKFTKHLGIEINIIDAEQFNSIIHTANKGSEDKIYLLKTRNHFDVIKSLTAFYDTPYYCHECKKAYTKRDKHKCPSKCLSCFTYTKDIKCEGKEIVCEKCNRKFFGKRCFKNHLKNRSKIEGKTDIVCDTVKKCNDCSRIITGKYVNCHKCGYSECTNCGKYVGKNHKCFKKKVKAKGGNCMTFKMESCYNDDSIKKTDWCYPCRTYTEKYMFYDFEATQNTGTHTINLSIAQDFNGKEYIHYSIEEFCKGFLNDKFKGYTFIVHNSKGYDCHFVLKWLIDQSIKPYCIYNGAKIMFMEISKLSIRFIDSLNFLQMPLKSFSKTFGMSELKKGYFPHYFNKECNKDYVGTIPSKKHYGYNQMKPDERTKFLKWYEKRVCENYVYDFKKEILEYCRSDVDILRRGIMKLREDFIELENIYPLRYITITSICMTIYCSNYMPNKTIALVQEYAKTDNFIAGSSKCTTKDLSCLLTKLLSTIKDGLVRYCNTKTSRNGVNNMWILKNSTSLLSSLDQLDVRTAKSVQTFDFSTLYTSIPHDLLKSRISNLVHNAFRKKDGSVRYTHIKLTRAKGYFTHDINGGGDNMFTADSICEMIEFLIDNIFVQFGGRLFRQVIGIPMGTNCAPLLADLFLYSYENEFLDNMIRSGHRRLARSFNLCYRYIDDLIVFNNKKFLDYLKEIYPSQLTVEKANKSDHLADYLDLTFIIDSGGKLSTRLYDKRDDFDFHIVNFPFLSSNIPSGPSYGVYISQLIRYARCCSHYNDFRYRH